MRSLMKDGSISTYDLIAVYIITTIFSLLNYWSVELLTSLASLISVSRLDVPIPTIIMLLVFGFDIDSYGHPTGTFMSYGNAPIFAATTASGIIFPFNAFQTIISVGSEVRNPEKNIARGTIISFILSAILYTVLQSTFITSVPSSMLREHGWSDINSDSPFVNMAILLGLNWLAILLYTEVVMSPFGTGVSFVAVAGHVLRAVEEDGHIPKLLGKTDKKYDIPRVVIASNTVISAVVVTLFRGWGTSAAIISTATLVAYLADLTTVISLRKMAPEMARPFKANILKFMIPLSFVLAPLAIHWAMWPTTAEVILIIILGLPIYFFYGYKTNWKSIKRQIDGSLRIIVYLIVLAFLSFIGSKEPKGLNQIHYPWDFLVIVTVALISYQLDTTNYFGSIYFKRANKLDKKIGDELRETRKRACHKDQKECDRQE